MQEGNREIRYHIRQHGYLSQSCSCWSGAAWAVSWWLYIYEYGHKDIKFILNSKNLEKKSTLRKLFEKEKTIVCVPFYEDNNQTLNSIISLFFRNKNISISQQLINVLIERSRGDRKNLNNELGKIDAYLLNKKNLMYLLIHL